MTNWPILILLIFASGVILTFFYMVTIGQQTNTPTNEEKTSITPSSPQISIIDPAYGSTTPQITIVEFSDFTCTYCASTSEGLKELVATYPNDVQVVWKDFPNTYSNPFAKTAAIAARCAQNQSRFWDYHDYLFANQTILNDSTILTIANTLELDTTAFNECVTSEETLPIVQKTFEEGQNLDITATPAIFINDQPYYGSTDFDTLSQLVNDLIQ